MKLKVNAVDIEVEDSASVNPHDLDLQRRPVILLIMDFGFQLTAWPVAWVQELVDAGYRVVRFDNRDCGLSTSFEHWGTPSLLWALCKLRVGCKVRGAYTLADMANDALGVLEALGIRRAHIVGAGLGAMVAQRMAIAAPERTLSLTSMMSTSGASGLPWPTARMLRVLLSRPKGSQEEDTLRYGMHLLKTLGSADYPIDDAQLYVTTLEHLQRSRNLSGVLRQALAAMADTLRAALLLRIKAPTLVLHGTADPLFPYACGEDTVQRISGAKMVGIAGMGHDFAPEPMVQMLLHLVTHLKAVDMRRNSV